MDKYQFITRITAHAPDEIKNYVPEVVDILNDFISHERGYLMSDIPKVIQAAGGPLGALLAERDNIGGGTELKSIRQDWLPSEFLIDLITPWVEDVREVLFGSKMAPFSSEEQAIRWFGEVREKSSEWERQQDAFFKKYPVMSAPWGKEVPHGHTPWLASKHEEYPRLPRLVQTNIDLFYKAGEIDEATGFDFFSIVMYILANIKPVLPCFKLHTQEEVKKLPQGKDLVNRSVRVTIRGELSPDEWRSLYRDIRRELRLKRTKAFNEKHLEIYRMVQQRGSPPKQRGMGTAFWESVRVEWNKGHPEDAYSTWREVKQVYCRLYNRLKGRYLAEGE